MARAKGRGGSLAILMVGESARLSELEGLLAGLGHVLTRSATVAEAFQRAAGARPDVVVLGGEPEAVVKDVPAPVLVAPGVGEERAAEWSTFSNVYGIVTEPMNAALLELQLNIAVSRWSEREELVGEVKRLGQELETRRLMDRAKAVLMKRGNLSEEEAHRRLQQESQKRRVAMAELCRRIIESDEVIGA